MSVLPLIVPDMVADPFAVVTVQSPVCADGFDSTAFTHTWSSSIAALVMVAGSDDTFDVLTSTTPIFEPMNLNNDDNVFTYSLLSMLQSTQVK